VSVDLADAKSPRLTQTSSDGVSWDLIVSRHLKYPTWRELKKASDDYFIDEGLEASEFR
jgi:hypothetical protein